MIQLDDLFGIKMNLMKSKLWW